MRKQLLGVVWLMGLFSLTANALAVDLSSPSQIEAEAKVLSFKAENLDINVAKLGLESYSRARAQGLDPQQIFTIVDYSHPSTTPRMWVFDMKNNNLLYKELVAHAKNSGDNIPTEFSNAPNSLKSSVGLFVTGQTYYGHEGYSLRLNGLEKGFNDNAAARNIVVHPAPYVSSEFAATHGRLGRSWGCFALNPQVAGAVINTIKAGSLIFAYAPEPNWLSHSLFLSGKIA